MNQNTYDYDKALIDVEEGTSATTITLTNLIRPLFDPYTGQSFNGNHHDLIISRFRDGDTVTESTAWTRTMSGFLNRRKQTFSISELVDVTKSEGVQVEDDIPQGCSRVV
jgi:hypothetical protein